MTVVPRRAVEVLHPDPVVLRVRDFMSGAECAQLIAEAETVGFTASTVQEHVTQETRSRTSATCNFGAGASALVRALEERFAALVGESVCRVEPLQVTKYAGGQFYRPHFDWFLPHALRPIAHLGQRSLTLFVYLNDVPEEHGGGTNFPELDLTVQPEAGAGVWWNNTLRDGRTDARVLHQGLDVAEGVTKYGLNCWCRFLPWPERKESAPYGRYTG